MAIDGRDLMNRKPKVEDPAEHPAVRIVAFLLVAVPMVAVLALAYWVGTWDLGPIKGGSMGGIVSVLLTAASVGLVIFWKRLRRK